MIYFIYLFLFGTLFFQLISFIYNFNFTKIALESIFIKNVALKGRTSVFNNFMHIKKSFAIKETTSFNSQNKKTTLEDKEVVLKLEEYNQELIRRLKTLEYISVMEVELESKENIDQLLEILNLKATVQHDVIKILKKVNYYKSFQNKTKRI